MASSNPRRSANMPVMTPLTLPAWWPPSGYEEFTEAQLRELFRYLRTVVPPAMENARRGIQARAEDADPDPTVA